MDYLLVLLCYVICQAASLLSGSADCRVMLSIDKSETIELGGQQVCYHRDFELKILEQVVLSSDPEPCR